MTEAAKTAALDPVAGLLAEFRSVDTLKAAAAKVRDSGFTQWDAHSPFPIHGIERAMGVRPTPLPWLVLAAGIAGGFTALGMQWWMNAVSYPQNISGKPFFSLPANIPVAFELIVLFSALAAFGGALALNQLPQFSHFLFRAKRFHRATTDGFFLSIAATDPKFDEAATPDLLESFGAAAVEICRQPTAGRALPKALPWILIVAATLALLPPLVVALARQTKSPNPRIHPVADMDFQPKYKPQAKNAFFGDRRAMRPPVASTVALGELNADPHLYLGYRREQKADETQAGVKDERDYFTTFPDRVHERIPTLMARGRERFNIYCAVCHGQVGDGSGMTSLRALKRQDPEWTPPTSLHKSTIRNQPVGKLFNTITNGLGKMPGYAAQIPVDDRWAIVLYVRALQRSQNAAVED
ncbi:MAG: DUF3341 domain-containing protein, partial [Planctomycetes bacterium]|nr:DUF3341 domain-containing protein [Planctomycetota bacterium]